MTNRKFWFNESWRSLNEERNKIKMVRNRIVQYDIKKRKRNYAEEEYGLREKLWKNIITKSHSVKYGASWNLSTSGKRLAHREVVSPLGGRVAHFTGCVLTSLAGASLSTAGSNSHDHLHCNSMESINLPYCHSTWRPLWEKPRRPFSTFLTTDQKMPSRQDLTATNSGPDTRWPTPDSSALLAAPVFWLPPFVTEWRQLGT